jgi:hypothetical protein
MVERSRLVMAGIGHPIVGAADIVMSVRQNEMESRVEPKVLPDTYRFDRRTLSQRSLEVRGRLDEQ